MFLQQGKETIWTTKQTFGDNNGVKWKGTMIKIDRTSQMYQGVLSHGWQAQFNESCKIGSAPTQQMVGEVRCSTKSGATRLTSSIAGITSGTDAPWSQLMLLSSASLFCPLPSYRVAKKSGNTDNIMSFC